MPNPAIPTEESSEPTSLRDEILQAKSEIEALPEPVEQPTPDKPEATAEPDTPEPQKPKQPDIPAPNSWANEAKAKWAEIPAEARAYIAKREAEMHRAITQQDDLKSAGKAIRELVQPYGDLFKEMPDVKPPDLIRGYFETEKTLRHGTPEQKAHLIGNVIKAYGLDVGLLNASLGGQLPETRPDPRVETLEQRIARFEQAEAEREKRSHLSVIEKFMADNGLTEESINQELLADVQLQRTLNPQLSEGEILSRAWERHQWANPTLRQALIDKQRSENTSREAIDRAKRAGKSVAGSPGAGTVMETQDDDLRGMIAKQFRAAQGRV